MNVADIRAGIKTVLEANLTGIKVYTLAGGNIQMPAITVTTTEPFITYHSAMGGGLAEIRLDLTVLVNRADELRAQEQLDLYCSSGTGATKSVIDALQTDRTLDGSCSDHIITLASGYSAAEIGDAQAGSVSLTLTVYAPRT